MQKIIKGRKYDTDTAQEVCGYSNGLPSGDFDALCEQLYVKRTVQEPPMLKPTAICGLQVKKSFHFPKLTQRRSLKNTLHRKCTNSTSVKCQRVIPTEQQ